MKTGTYRMDADDTMRLRELSRLYEAQIDQLSDDELSAVEAQINERIHTLLGSQRELAVPLTLPKYRKPRSYMWGGFALIAAALALFMMRIDIDTEPTFERTKGQTMSQVACDLKLFQSDRSTPERHEHFVFLSPGHQLYAEVRCLDLDQGYLHLAQRDKNGTWQWVVRNQLAGAGHTWLQQDDRLVDFALYKDQELTILVTSQTLANSETLTADDMPGVRGILWMDKLSITER